MARVLLAEFESIRAEIAAHQAARTRYLALAVTATGAIGSFALGTEGAGETLVLLPYVLCGFAILYLKHTLDTETLGRYLRDSWWPTMRELESRATSASKESGELWLPAWDDWIADLRGREGRLSLRGLLGWFPPALVFIATSAGALSLAFIAGTGDDLLFWQLARWTAVGLIAFTAVATALVLRFGAGWN